MANVVKKHSISSELAQKMVNAAVAKAKELGVSENVAIPKSRCINRLKKHPSHSAPNRRLPVYPAGETLILGGDFRPCSQVSSDVRASCQEPTEGIPA